MPRLITRRAFWGRFTAAELIIVDLASQHNHTATPEEQQAAALIRVYYTLISDATYVDLDDPQLIAGLQQMAAAGLLTQARADQILTAPVRPEEEPLP
jgi:hypothetical protein